MELSEHYKLFPTATISRSGECYTYTRSNCCSTTQLWPTSRKSLFPSCHRHCVKKKNHTGKLITLFESWQNLSTKYTTWLMYEIWWRNNILLALQKGINFIYYRPRSNRWFFKVHTPSCTRCIFSKCCKLGKPSYVP